MINLAMALACCLATSPATITPALGSDTAVVYARVVGAIRAEQTGGVGEKIYLADERLLFPYGSTGRHSPQLLAELVSQGVVDGIYIRERRSEKYPCVDCTRVVLGAITEYHRTLYIDPKDLSKDAGPGGIPVKHWVDVTVARPCSPEGKRGGWCVHGEENSRRYYLSLQPDGTFRLEACTVTREV
jgi:hypothetical protein